MENVLVEYHQMTRTDFLAGQTLCVVPQLSLVAFCMRLNCSMWNHGLSCGSRLWRLHSLTHTIQLTRTMRWICCAAFCAAPFISLPAKLSRNAYSSLRKTNYDLQAIDCSSSLPVSFSDKNCSVATRCH